MPKMKKKKFSKKTQNTIDIQKSVAPNVATIFRARIRDAMSYEMVLKATNKIRSLLWVRDGGSVKAIQSAETAEDLFGKIPLAHGLGADAWHERARDFGDEMVSLAKKYLEEARTLKDPELQTQRYEILISELRWRGKAGANVLIETFDALDDYGRCLASVVLGLLRATQSADMIWKFYNNVQEMNSENRFVGALWGLIDIKDERVAGALYQRLIKQSYFYELMGFLALAGDARSLVPLLVLSPELDEDQRWDPLIAASAISHRIGRQATIEELSRWISENEREKEGKSVAGISDILLSNSKQDIEEYFQIYYGGFSPDTIRDDLYKI
jgi:hypothetical protein